MVLEKKAKMKKNKKSRNKQNNIKGLRLLRRGGLTTTSSQVNNLKVEKTSENWHILRSWPRRRSSDSCTWWCFRFRRCRHRCRRRSFLGVLGAE